MIKAMDDDDYVKLLDRAFTFQLALVSNGRLGSDNFTKVQKEAKEIFQDIEGEMKPWLGKRSREDRAQAERDNFAELWEDFAGFALDDQEALAEWESQLSKHTSGSVADLQDRESAEAAQAEDFKKRVEEIRQKRARQQGR